MMTSLIVFIGGGLGAVARFILGTWISQHWGRNFPLGTLVVNVSGSFLIGLLMTLLAERFTVNPAWRLLLIVGFLGGYTTFSTFEYETGRLLADGSVRYAALNVLVSVAAGFAALKTGEVLAKLI